MSGSSWVEQGKEEQQRRMSLDWHDAQDVTHLSRGKRRYAVLSSAVFEPTARQLEASQPDRFRFFPIHWNKFPDGTDNIGELDEWEREKEVEALNETVDDVLQAALGALMSSWFGCIAS
jgi:hypothetical protein